MICKAWVLDLLQWKTSQLSNQMGFPLHNSTQAKFSCGEGTWNCACLPGSLKTCPSDFQKKKKILPFLSFIYEPKLIKLKNRKGKKLPRQDGWNDTEPLSNVLMWLWLSHVAKPPAVQSREKIFLMILQLRVFNLLQDVCWFALKLIKALGQPCWCWGHGVGEAEHPRNWKWSPLSVCGHQRSELQQSSSLSSHQGSDEGAAMALGCWGASGRRLEKAVDSQGYHSSTSTGKTQSLSRNPQCSSQSPARVSTCCLSSQIRMKETFHKR